MSGLTSCNSWRDLKKPENPFYGAMFSRSHKKRKRKRVLQPIDNPSERGRSLEARKDCEASGMRSISVENSALLKIKHDSFKSSILDPYSQTILSTDSSLELKHPPKPSKVIQKKPGLPKRKPVSEESSVENKYAEIDKAISSNAINMRNKYAKPLHPDNPKPHAAFNRGRKYVKPHVHCNALPYAPDLKPVSMNTFQIGLPGLELEYSEFYHNSQKIVQTELEDLIKNVHCKICLN